MPLIDHAARKPAASSCARVDAGLSTCRRTPLSCPLAPLAPGRKHALSVMFTICMSCPCACLHRHLQIERRGRGARLAAWTLPRRCTPSRRSSYLPCVLLGDLAVFLLRHRFLADIAALLDADPGSSGRAPDISVLDDLHKSSGPVPAMNVLGCCGIWMRRVERDGRGGERTNAHRQLIWADLPVQ